MEMETINNKLLNDLQTLILDAEIIKKKKNCKNNILHEHGQFK